MIRRRPIHRIVSCRTAALGAALFLLPAPFLAATQAVASSPGERTTAPNAPTREGSRRVEGTSTTYDIYRQTFVYGDTAFPITDIRPDNGNKVYSDKESYEIRRLTVCRAGDGGALLEHRPVLVFVHGGAWTDGYGDWYAFVANAFTGRWDGSP